MPQDTTAERSAERTGPVPSEAVLERMATRVRLRLAAEESTPASVTAKHPASIAR